jgi:hypothetical protein
MWAYYIYDFLLMQVIFKNFRDPPHKPGSCAVIQGNTRATGAFMASALGIPH